MAETVYANETVSGYTYIFHLRMNGQSIPV